MDLLRAAPQELQSVLDLMAEKEVRLRTPLEELDLLMPPEETSILAEGHEEEMEGEASVEMCIESP